MVVNVVTDEVADVVINEVMIDAVVSGIVFLVVAIATTGTLPLVAAAPTALGATGDRHSPTSGSISYQYASCADFPGFSA